MDLTTFGIILVSFYGIFIFLLRPKKKVPEARAEIQRKRQVRRQENRKNQMSLRIFWSSFWRLVEVRPTLDLWIKEFVEEKKNAQ